jgi:hypothetical protein
VAKRFDAVTRAPLERRPAESLGASEPPVPRSEPPGSRGLAAPGPWAPSWDAGFSGVTRGRVFRVKWLRSIRPKHVS